MLKKVLTLVFAFSMLLSGSICSADSSNVSKSQNPTVIETYYKDGCLYKNEMIVLSPALKNANTKDINGQNTTEIRLYKSTIIMQKGLFRPSVELAARVKVSYSGSFGQIMSVIPGSEYATADGSGSYEWENLENVYASVVDSGRALNLQVRGKLTITKQYAYSANLTPKDIADFGFEASGNDYYRKITTVGTKINLQ